MFVSKKRYELFEELHEALACRVELLEANIDDKSLSSKVATIKELIDYCEAHYVDELSVDGIIIKKSVHILPKEEVSEEEKLRRQREIIGWSAQ